MHLGHRLLAVFSTLAIVFSGFCLGQISVPEFGTRGEVPPVLLESFMLTFRGEIARATGLQVKIGELVTPGIASSLEPTFAGLIAELDQARYAVSGEIREVSGGGGEFIVNFIVVDVDQERSTDLITQPLSLEDVSAVSKDLAATVAAFARPIPLLDSGNAGLFVSSQPSEAEVFIEGVALGRTGDLEVVMLAPGRYTLELRKEGFLPETRTLDLEDGETKLVRVVLTAISGGVVTVRSLPEARLFLDGVFQGQTPISIEASRGVHTITLQREGFQPDGFSVEVLSYRVTRVERTLNPVREPLLFWPENRQHLVFINSILQPGGYAPDLSPGPLTLEVRRGTELQRYQVTIPPSGVFRLDPATGEIVPLTP